METGRGDGRPWAVRKVLLQHTPCLAAAVQQWASRSLLIPAPGVCSGLGLGGADTEASGTFLWFSGISGCFWKLPLDWGPATLPACVMKALPYSS